MEKIPKYVWPYVKMEILYVRVMQILLPVYPDIIYLLKCESLWLRVLNPLLEQDPKIIHSFRHKNQLKILGHLREIFQTYFHDKYVRVWPQCLELSAA